MDLPRRSHQTRTPSARKLQGVQPRLDVTSQGTQAHGWPERPRRLSCLIWEVGKPKPRSATRQAALLLPSAETSVPVIPSISAEPILSPQREKEQVLKLGPGEEAEEGNSGPLGKRAGPGLPRAGSKSPDSGLPPASSSSNSPPGAGHRAGRRPCLLPLCAPRQAGQWSTGTGVCS